MNLSSILVILLVLFNGLKYSLCEEPFDDYADCTPKTGKQVVDESLHCVLQVFLMSIDDKDTACCISMDTACRTQSALKTQCKPKSGFDSWAKNKMSKVKDQCSGLTKSLCKSKMTTSTDAKCTQYEPNICNAVLPISVDGLILWLSFLIPLINILF